MYVSRLSRRPRTFVPSRREAARTILTGFLVGSPWGGWSGRQSGVSVDNALRLSRAAPDGGAGVRRSQRGQEATAGLRPHLALERCTTRLHSRGTVTSRAAPLRVTIVLLRVYVALCFEWPVVKEGLVGGFSSRVNAGSIDARRRENAGSPCMEPLTGHGDMVALGQAY